MKNETTRKNITNLLQIKLDKSFIQRTAQRELETIGKILERPNILPDDELNRYEILYNSFKNIVKHY